jgi:hypothetical protein
MHPCKVLARLYGNYFVFTLVLIPERRNDSRGDIPRRRQAAFVQPFDPRQSKSAFTIHTVTLSIGSSLVRAGLPKTAPVEIPRTSKRRNEIQETAGKPPSNKGMIPG